MTSEPRLTASGANALLTDDDAEMNVTSTSLNESGVASCTFNSVFAYGSCLPCERLDANARIFSGGWLRSARSSKATVPTAPVAPTIAILRLDDDDDCIVVFFRVDIVWLVTCTVSCVLDVGLADISMLKS